MAGHHHLGFRGPRRGSPPQVDARSCRVGVFPTAAFRDFWRRNAL